MPRAAAAHVLMCDIEKLEMFKSFENGEKNHIKLNEMKWTQSPNDIDVTKIIWYVYLCDEALNWTCLFAFVPVIF